MHIADMDVNHLGANAIVGGSYGIATGQSLEISGRMGCVAAAEVISHFGARPEADLKALFKQAGLI